MSQIKYNSFCNKPEAINKSVLYIPKTETNICSVFDLLPPHDSYTAFKNDEEKLNYLKNHNIINSKSLPDHPFIYRGVYASDCCDCEIIGYTPDDLIIISLDDHLHCLDSAYFKDMQTIDKNETTPYLFNCHPVYFSNPQSGKKALIESFMRAATLLFPKLHAEILEYSDTSFLGIRLFSDSTIYIPGGASGLLFKVKESNDKLTIWLSKKHKRSLDNEKIKYEIIQSGKNDDSNYFCVCQYDVIKNQSFFNIFPLLVYNSFSFPSFGCCSKYKECSKAEKCLHIDPLYSYGCQYRRNLESGNIFYNNSDD